MGHPSPATTAPRASAPLSAPSAPAAAPAQTASKTLPRALLALLLASNLLASINQSMINIALDAVATEFHVELAMANWMVLGFTIVAPRAKPPRCSRLTAPSSEPVWPLYRCCRVCSLPM